MAPSSAQLGPIASILAALEQYFSFSNNSNAAVGPNANLWNTIFSSGFPVNLLSYLAQNQSAQALQGVNSQIGQGVSEGESALGGGAAIAGVARRRHPAAVGRGRRRQGLAQGFQRVQPGRTGWSRKKEDENGPGEAHLASPESRSPTSEVKMS